MLIYFLIVQTYFLKNIYTTKDNEEKTSNKCRFIICIENTEHGLNLFHIDID